MKRYKIISIVSIVINIVLLFVIFKNYNENKSINVPMLPQDKDLSSRYNFEKIFLEKNDSVYKIVYNKSFEDLPVQAYLLACTYYLLKKDSSSKKDIEMINSEIKAIYGKAPDVVFTK